MVFKKNNIVYNSKKVYNDLKNIEKNIKPFYNKLPNISSYYYTPSFYRDTDTLIKIEKSVNKFKKTKLIDEDCSFHEEFPAISSFIYEAYYYEDSVRNSSDKKFIDIANNLFNKIDCYKSMEIFSKVLIL